jgi:transglutaminase-like putative cysteine protease
MRWTEWGLCVTLLLAGGPAQAGQAPAVEDLRALASGIAGPDGTPEERTRRLTAWVNTELVWTTTDYEARTVDDIIRRRGGNCAELSRVLARLLDLSGIAYRTVREINIQPESARRQATAEARVAGAGARMSVFGRTHNDHVWLEVADGAGGWIPADPAVGTVGLDEWVAARLAVHERRPPAVAAAAPIVADMLVPIAVVVGGPDGEARSDTYLVRGLDNAYGGRLSTLPSWQAWVDQVRAFAPLARGAFAGTVNLHEHAAAIDALGATYRDLQHQAARR